MDVGTLIGIIIALICIFTAMTLEGTALSALFVPPALIVVIPTTIAVTVASGYSKDIPLVIRRTKEAFLGKMHDGTESIETMVKFADKARREGLLALEQAAKDIDDPFLKKGIQLAVDGTDPEQLAEILEAEIQAKRAESKIPIKFHENAGGFAPTIGIIGTVLSLVHVMHNLSDPGSLGPAISSAFIATLMGVGSANVVYLPLSNKIRRQYEVEIHHMELVVEGVLSIQAGANPRVIHQKLTALLGADSVDKKAA
jgi:chemotaxis protein MotA